VKIKTRKTGSKRNTKQQTSKHTIKQDKAREYDEVML
jgi:hypothetical protein